MAQKPAEVSDSGSHTMGGRITTVSQAVSDYLPEDEAEPIVAEIEAKVRIGYTLAAAFAKSRSKRPSENRAPDESLLLENLCKTSIHYHDWVYIEALVRDQHWPSEEGLLYRSGDKAYFSDPLSMILFARQVQEGEKINTRSWFEEDKLLEFLHEAGGEGSTIDEIADNMLRQVGLSATDRLYALGKFN